MQPFFFACVHAKSSSWSQAFLAEFGETGDKYLCATKSNKWKSFNRKINVKDVELFQKGSVHKFYRLKVLITLDQVNTLL